MGDVGKVRRDQQQLHRNQMLQTRCRFSIAIEQNAPSKARTDDLGPGRILGRVRGHAEAGLLQQCDVAINPGVLKLPLLLTCSSAFLRPTLGGRDCEGAQMKYTPCSIRACDDKFGE